MSSYALCSQSAKLGGISFAKKKRFLQRLPKFQQQPTVMECRSRALELKKRLSLLPPFVLIFPLAWSRLGCI